MTVIRVNYGQSVHGEEEVEAVVKVLRGSTQMGPHVQEFEIKVAALFAKRFAVMVNSGSSALYLAVEVLGLDPGSEVITPVLTFATTVAPLVRAGLIPAFIDVEEGTYNIDVSKIEEMTTPNTSAIVVPNLIGNLPDWDRIREIADHHNLEVLEDSADTLGAILRGTSTGRRSDISTTSFYGSHVINCAGNGGLLAMNDPEVSRRAKLLRSWGRSSSLFQTEESERIEVRFDVELNGIPYDRKFIFEEIGFNLEPSELGAAFGLVQLNRLKANIEARRRNFEKHLAFFGQHKQWFILPRELEGAYTGWLAFPLTLRERVPFTRRDFQIYLEENNIQTRPVFTGNILRQPAFANIRRKESPSGYPEADKVTRGGVLIGCHHGLTDEQIAHVHTARWLIAVIHDLRRPALHSDKGQEWDRPFAVEDNGIAVARDQRNEPDDRYKPAESTRNSSLLSRLGALLRGSAAACDDLVREPKRSRDLEGGTVNPAVVTLVTQLGREAHDVLGRTVHAVHSSRSVRNLHRVPPLAIASRPISSASFCAQDRPSRAGAWRTRARPTCRTRGRVASTTAWPRCR